jgi:hypothetical protein
MVPSYATVCPLAEASTIIYKIQRNLENLIVGTIAIQVLFTI